MRRFRLAGAILALPVFLLALCLTGCTSQRELRELAIVEGIGVDRNPDGSFFLTFQVYQPQGGGGSSEKSSSTNQTGIVQGSGVSLFDASRNVTRQMGRKLYYANCNVLIVGREVCEENLYSVMDFLNRNHEINTKERVFMAEDKASDILTAQQGGNYIPAHDLRLLAENGYNTSQMVDEPLGDLNVRVSDGITSPYLSVLRIRPDESAGPGQQSSGSSGQTGGSSGQSGGKQIVEANGTAIFDRQGRLLDVMDKNATRGLLWITGKVRSGVINITSPDFSRASLEIRRAGSTVRVSSRDGKPVIRVEVQFDTGITELQLPPGGNERPAVIREMVAKQSEAVRQEIRAALEAALRQHNADVFGFGLKVYEHRPDLWRKLEKNWSDQAGRTEVEVSVHSTIINDGIVYH